MSSLLKEKNTTDSGENLNSLKSYGGGPGGGVCVESPCYWRYCSTGNRSPGALFLINNLAMLP